MIFCFVISELLTQVCSDCEDVKLLICALSVCILHIISKVFLSILEMSTFQKTIFQNAKGNGKWVYERYFHLLFIYFSTF